MPRRPMVSPTGGGRFLDAPEPVSRRMGQFCRDRFSTDDARLAGIAAAANRPKERDFSKRSKMFPLKHGPNEAESVLALNLSPGTYRIGSMRQVSGALLALQPHSMGQTCQILPGHEFTDLLESTLTICQL